HYGIVAKVNRFSESTRKNRHIFPKHMGYRTKLRHLCNIFPCSGDKSFVTSPLYLCPKKRGAQTYIGSVENQWG
ncbi:hypothetical protein, partial [uncultured Parabacteroides sp.]|uniref:hypothetical protein n=1 Tax=uncultured Parabacteroides sp. TaxID=512312 RepID=UPI0025EB1B1C